MNRHEIQGKNFLWLDVTKTDDADFEYLHKTFKFHPLDFDDLRNESELPKMEIYKHYLFFVFSVPTFDRKIERVNRQNIGVFISDDYVVTVSSGPNESVERFFTKLKRSVRMKRDVMGKSTGYFLYQLLAYLFRDAKVILHELVREAHNVELSVYDSRTTVTTKRLGVVRRNVLFMRHIIDPQRILMNQIINIKKSYLSKDLDIYYEDIKDLLDSMSLIADNLKNIVDGLFDVNEALLSHRTNEIIRVLTIISVMLMPPTLITGYFGMNIDGLPLVGDVLIVTLIILLSILLCWIVVLRIDRRK